MTVETFSYTGSEQTWTVPNGIEHLRVKLWGAGGQDGHGTGANGSGKRGGYVDAIMNVSPGETLYLYVGGSGSNGGWNGGGNAGNDGGNGGGATDIRSGSNSLSSRDVVAAGGGGGGHAEDDNGDPGNSASGGGKGGSNVGQDGGDSCANDCQAQADGGDGGTQSSGGSGGSSKGSDGSDGSFGSGGSGGTYNGFEEAYQGGGGGGGGYYGGGGGGADGVNYAAAGGGGGGSNYTGGANYVVDVNSRDGNGGNGYIEITYSQVERYDGTSWVEDEMLYYDGSIWRVPDVKVQ